MEQRFIELPGFRPLGRRLVGQARHLGPDGILRA
jgi:hypothetical protein